MPATEPHIISLPALIAAVTLPEAVIAVEQAFRLLARHQVRQPSPIGLDLPAGQIHIKSAQLSPEQPVVVKVATGFPRNPAQGLPAGDGAMMVLDPNTGQLKAVLLDRGWLTDLRTAATTAIAVRTLSHPSRRLGLLGTGVQADLTLHTLDSVGLLPPDIVIWGRDPVAAQRLADRHADRSAALVAAESVQMAVDGADLVITVTAAREPILAGAWLTANALIIAVGADSPGKRECDADVLTRASRIVTDSRDQAIRLGELQHAVDPASYPIVELAHLVAQPDVVSGIQLCDLTGVGAADAAVGALAVQRCRPAPPGEALPTRSQHLPPPETQSR